MSTDRERVEALAKVLEVHIAEAGGWHCSCQPIDELDGTRLLLDATWDAHAAQALLDSSAMRDLLAEAKADALKEAADALDRDEHPDDPRWTASLLGYHGESEWLRDRAANPYRETSNGGRDD